MAENQGPVLIGLHITKCAGTTLAEHVFKKLHPTRWYFCSSPYNMAVDARQDFAERVYIQKINFVFGHYVHESLNSIFAGRDIFWFTGVREPIKRAISEYYQICKVRAFSGKPPLSAEEFLAVRSNTMCREFLRAFPTIDSEAGGNLLERASQAAEMFDLIYGSENFEETITPLLKRIGVGLEGLASANTRSARDEDAAYLQEQADILATAARPKFAEDIALYEMLKPHIGLWQPFAKDEAAMARRAGWTDRMTTTPEAGLARFNAHLAHFYVRDFVNVGRKAELEALLERRREWIDALTSALDGVR